MTGRSTLRRYLKKARWIGLAAVLPVIWACNSRQLEIPSSTPTRTFNNVFQETVNRDVDILFMIDNSRSMLPLQTKLLTNFPVFMQVLEGLPMGLPNVHIAVVSSDMGAGRNQVELCNNDQGFFQAQPRGTCTMNPLMPGQNFISNVNGVANYTGTIEAAFTCIAALGQDGCGFEAQLESVVRALGADGYAVPNQNTGFLRKNAFLSLIYITNEDDCSVPSDSNLFDPNSRLVSDPLGPLQSFRCNEYGHLCGTPPAAPSRTVAADYQNCVPAEEMGQLIPVHTIADQIKALKADPSKILVAVIAGLPTTYHVSLTAPLIAQDPQMWPQIDHSCMENSGEYADPSIRLNAFVNAFGSNGLFLSICADSFAPALQTIAEQIGKTLGPKCVEGTLADKDLTTAGIQPDCTVVDHTFDDAGNQIDTTVPACADNNNTPPCWQLQDGNAMACMGQHILAVMRPPGNQPSDLNSSVSCAICIPNVETPACGCNQGHTACGQRCVDLQSDGANCGACGTICPRGCANGACN
jgi:hypothetical protein